MPHLRRLRLWSGLVMFAYVTMHLLNHALGLHSIAAMERALTLHLAVWRNPVGVALLYGAIFSHGLAGLVLLYERRSLRMPGWQIAQHVLGFILPFLLAWHVALATVVTREHELSRTYAMHLHATVQQLQVRGTLGVWAILIAWLHGCMGIHFWLRMYGWYPKVKSALYPLALLIPVLAEIGFIQASREVRIWMDRGEGFPGQVLLTEAGDRLAIQVGNVVGMSVLGAVVLALLARAVRSRLAARKGTISVAYPDGRRVLAPRGASILEASQFSRVPHASVCGGRGRCSTCRVGIHHGFSALPAASPLERKVLDRVGAAPNVRLACQTRPSSDVTVVPLVSPAISVHKSLRNEHGDGRELEIAILFADLRGFTSMSEHKLPYDVVYILNRYFAAMGSAVEEAGGYLDKVIGDGVMALFGMESDLATGCRQSLEAARLISARLTELNAALAADLASPLRIGMGIHAGHAVVGQLGYSSARSLTAIGDSVNTASRLESASKELGCELVVSEHVAAHAGIDLSMFERIDFAVRGRGEPLPVLRVTSAQLLPRLRSSKPDAEERVPARGA